VDRREREIDEFRSLPARPRVGVKTRAAFWFGNLGLVALAITLLGPGALASFNTTRSVSATYSTGVLNAPSPLSCVWAPLFGTYPVVWTVWPTSGQEFAAGYNVLRSDTTGGPYSLRATYTPNTAWFHIEDPTPHTTIRYYVVESFRGNWTSPYTNEVATNQCQNAINPFAGNGTAGFSGDAGPATSAQLNSPQGMAFDASGNAYIADKLNNRIRMVTPAGTISTFAGGTGAASACSYSGNVSSLRLNAPAGVAVDSSGNVYISDTAQNCVRKVTPAGNVSLLAGEGATTTCNSTGAATSVQLQAPIGLTVDSAGAVYIADAGNLCVRKVSGGTYSHVAGGGATTTCNSTGSATSVQLTIPVDVELDASGTVYIAEHFFGAGCVRKVSGGTYSHVAGGGATATCNSTGVATTVQLREPNSLVVDGAGNVLVTDRMLNCVRRIAAGNYSHFAYTGTAGSSGNNGPAVEALGNLPSGLAIDPAGHTYIVETGNNVVRKVW